MLGTFHLSPGLKVIACLQFGPSKFQKLQNNPFSPSPVCLSALSHRRCVATPPAALGRLPVPPLARSGFHVSPRSSIAAFASRRALSSPCHAHRALPPAATATPPWIAQERTPNSFLSRASTSGTFPLSIPLAHAPFSPLPELRTHRRHPPNAGELDLAVEPPLCSSSARADTLASSALASRSSPTPPPRQSLTRDPRRH